LTIRGDRHDDQLRYRSAPSMKIAHGRASAVRFSRACCCGRWVTKHFSLGRDFAFVSTATFGVRSIYGTGRLESKDRFVSQVITGDNAARRAEDIGSQELSYADVKAITSS
jgi:hypothetical protein